ncbi:MAG: hypothetical protein LV480_13985 [Methylacidiphilales bacterium]|nr:hypothetical protein [Candidatus Methylacidiphilales bacterium]
MKIMLILVGVVLTFFATLREVVGDPLPMQSNIPANLWEPQAGVTDIAFMLTTVVENGKSKSYIKAYVKNITTSTLALVVSSRTDEGFDFFTIDSSGVKHLLHDHDPYHGQGTRIQEIAANMDSVKLQQIAPGKTILRIIIVSPDDVMRIKTSLFQLKCSIINPLTSQLYHIESSPKVLTETVVTAPTKN